MPQDRWPELCKLYESDDRLPVRDAGRWTADKLYFWNRYIDITTRAMVGHPRWPAGLAYVDLFAGPGICKLRENGQRIPGNWAFHSNKCIEALLVFEDEAAAFVEINAAGGVRAVGCDACGVEVDCGKNTTGSAC